MSENKPFVPELSNLDDGTAPNAAGVNNAKPGTNNTASFGAAGASNRFNPDTDNPLTFISSLSRVTATGNAGSGTPMEVQKLLDELALRTLNDPRAIRLTSVVVEDTNLNIPAILLYSVFNKKVLFTVLVLEQLGQALTLVPQQAGNRSIEIDMPTIRYWDDTMIKISLGILVRALNTAHVSFDSAPICVSAVVIQRSVDLKNMDQLAPFYDHCTAAIAACIRSLQGYSTSELTYNMLASKALQLVAKHEIRPGNTSRTPTGDIIASDFSITLVGRNSNTAQRLQQLHNVSEDVVLSSVAGYVDFAYHAPEQKFLSPQPGMQVLPVAGYDPLVVLTSLTPLGKTGRANDDLLAQLLGLASMAGLLSDFRWSTIFTRASGDNCRKTSIGVLGLEHNPFSGTQFTPKELNVVSGTELIQGSDRLTALGVIQIYTTPTMTLALDITQGGPLAWVQSLFATAAQGSTEEAQIIRELDNFSGNRFSSVWDRKQPIIAMPSVQVHLGHFTDADGNLCDIRSLDYLTMLKLTKADISIMEPYSAGFQPGNCDLITIDTKRRIIESIAPSVVFTGMATRIFFNTNFINALDAMLAACGLKITLEGLMDITGQNQRGTMFNTQYRSAVDAHGVFQQYGNVVSGQFTPMNPFTTGGLPGYTS